MRRLLSLTILAAWIFLCPAARAQDRVTLGLDWKAEAEYGGYYQAIATGIYARHGLDVTIRQGGPQLNQLQLLLAGRLDFSIVSNGFLALNLAAEKLPAIAVAAFFQKDPTILLAHPGRGHDSFESLKGAPILIGADARLGFWTFLRSRFGYTDAQIRPYTFNLAPFLSNPDAAQQGYLGSEPYSVKTQAGFDPVVLLLADAGFEAYGSLMAARTALVGAKPDLVQRFVDASIEGWYSYLYMDPAPAHALIRTANPEMTDGLLEYGHRVLRERGIVDSGDAATLGIGAMTEARWDAFFRSMAAEHLYAPDLDWHAAYTTRFVDKGMGLPSRPK